MKLTLAKLEQEFSNISENRLSPRKFNIEVLITEQEKEDLLIDIQKFSMSFYKMSTLAGFEYKLDSGIILKFKTI